MAEQEETADSQISPNANSGNYVCAFFRLRQNDTLTFAGNALANPVVTMVSADFGYKLRIVSEGYKEKLLHEKDIFN